MSWYWRICSNFLQHQAGFFLSVTWSAVEATNRPGDDKESGNPRPIAVALSAALSNPLSIIGPIVLQLFSQAERLDKFQSTSDWGWAYHIWHGYWGRRNPHSLSTMFTNTDPPLLWFSSAEIPNLIWEGNILPKFVVLFFKMCRASRRRYWWSCCTPQAWVHKFLILPRIKMMKKLNCFSK